MDSLAPLCTFSYSQVLWPKIHNAFVSAPMRGFGLTTFTSFVWQLYANSYLWADMKLDEENSRTCFPSLSCMSLILVNLIRSFSIRIMWMRIILQNYYSICHKTMFQWTPIFYIVLHFWMNSKEIGFDSNQMVAHCISLALNCTCNIPWSMLAKHWVFVGGPFTSMISFFQWIFSHSMKQQH